MSKHKCPRVRVCKCGRRFRQSEKFANERMCSRCYRAHHDNFIRWLDGLSDEEHSEVYSHIKHLATELGVTVPQPELVPVELNPEQIDHPDQDAIDATAATLLADIDI